MKRIALWSTVAVVLGLMTFVSLRANARAERGWGGYRWYHAGPAGYLARELKLSSAQRKQIRTLWEAERPSLSAHMREFLDENKEMDALAAQGNPDPGKVKETADREAATIAALLTEKEQLQAKIYTTVLNPDQRTKADEWQKRWESRLGRAADRLGNRPAQE